MKEFQARSRSFNESFEYRNVETFWADRSVRRFARNESFCKLLLPVTAFRILAAPASPIWFPCKFSSLKNNWVSFCDNFGFLRERLFWNGMCNYSRRNVKLDTWTSIWTWISLSFLNRNGWNLVSRHIFSRCLGMPNFSSLSLVLSKLWSF